MRALQATHAQRPAADAAQRGALLVTLLIVMVPLLALVAGATTVMTGRNSKLLRSLQETKALFAAEAGIQQAAQMAYAGTLVSDTPVTRDLGAGMSNSFTAVLLSTDGVDNDGDTLIDEADERAFEVTSTGRHGQARKCLSALLVEPDVLPLFRATILTQGVPTIATKGSGRVSGFNTNINNSRGSPANDVAGIANELPHVTADLLSRYTASGNGRVEGSTAFLTTPSPYNLPGLIAAARNSVRNSLPPGTLNMNIGSGPANNFQVSYCPGDLKVTGNKTGAGILVVAGNLDIAGSFRYDGLVVVLGGLKMSGTGLINGAVIQGTAGTEITLTGNGTVRYSADAISRIRALLRPDYGIIGLREVSLW